MLSFYKAQSKIDGFFNQHFTYEDLVSIAKENHILLIDNQKFPEVISEIKSLGFHTDDGKFFILISDKVTNPNSKWYYLGHELGHYFLHNLENAFYTVDLKKGKIIDERSEYYEVMEAQANLFAKFLFLPLEYVRQRACTNMFDTQHDLVEELVEYTLDKLKEPKPTDRVRLTHLMNCILDSFLVFLGYQNVLYAQNGHMKHAMDLVRQVEIFERPQYLWNGRTAA